MYKIECECTKSCLYKAEHREQNEAKKVRKPTHTERDTQRDRFREK